MEEQSFGAYIKELRKKAGLTLAELGELVEVTKSYLSNLENGRREKPSREILQKLAKYLDTDYNYLCSLAGYIDAEISKQEKISFAAKLIVNQIIDVLDAAREQNSMTSVREYIDSFESQLLAGAKGENITIPELKKKLWYLEGDGDSYKSTIGKRSDSSKIEALLDALDNVLELEYSSERLKFQGKREIENIELVHYVTNNFVTYNNHPLTESDKQLLLRVLDALFPHYRKEE